MPVPEAGKRILQAIRAWPDPASSVVQAVEAGLHRFGGTEFRLGTREIGHVHGDYLVDIPFPKRVRDAVVEAGEAEPHHILPESGWVSLYLRTSEDVERAIRLLRRSYDLAAEKVQKQPTSAPKAARAIAAKLPGGPRLRT